MIDTLPLSTCSGGSNATPSIASFSGRVDGKLGDDSSPLPLATNSFFPSLAPAHGYQPVGTKRVTVDSFGAAMLAISTSLLSALATKRDLPSGETATASGVEPSGDEG